ENSTGRPNATRGVVVTAIDTLRVGVTLRINSPVFAIQYGCPEKYGGSDAATRYFAPPPGNGCKKVPPPVRASGSRDWYATHRPSGENVAFGGTDDWTSPNRVTR